MTYVVIAVGGPGTSGISTYVEELRRALAARGHRTDVAMGGGIRQGGGILRRLLPRVYARPGSEQLRLQIQRMHPDVVHVVSPELLAEDLGVPTVWTAWHHPHGFAGRWLASFEMRRFGLREVLWEMAGAWPGYRLDDAALRHCDRIATVSRRLAASLGRRGWPASFVPPMITLPESASPKSLPAVPRVVFSSANLGAPRKGLESLVQAFQHMENRGGLAVDLIGEPDARARRLLDGSRLATVATVHGRTDLEGAREIMSAANVLALPSRAEEFGYVALEALALGLPVVAFDVPNLDEMLTPECSRRVPPLDAMEFGRALSDVVADAGAYRRLSVGALHRAQAYSPAVCLPGLEALYRDAIEVR